MKSWKTTILGILGGVAILLTQAAALLDGNPDTVFDLQAVFAALSVFGIGVFARDNNKSSEDVGA